MHGHPYDQQSPQSGACVTADDATLTLTSGFAFGVVFFWISANVIYTHHYGIMSSVSLAWKFSVLSRFLPSLLFVPGNRWPFYCPHSFASQNVMKVWSYHKASFQTSFFPLIMCTYVSSMSFHDLMDHFFLSLNNIPFSGGTAVYLTIHSLKGISVAFTFWQLWIVLLYRLSVQVFVQVWDFNSFELYQGARLLDCFGRVCLIL